jgi:hypothetical protein
MRTRSCFAALVGVFLITLGQAGIAQDRVTLRDVQKAINDGGLAFSQNEIRRILRGFEIAPVPLNLRAKNLALVGLGSYIVNGQGGCNDCHTAPPYADGGNPFLGEPEEINTARYLAGGTPFGPPGDPNTPVSRNLTPQANGRPGGVTFEQFRRTLRTGRDLRNLPPFVPSADNDLLQVMPWPVFGNMLDRDLRAIYEYLRAIPSLPSAP